MVRSSRRSRGIAAVELTGAALLLATADTPLRGPFAALLLLVAPGLAAGWLFREAPWQTRIAAAITGTVVANVAVAQVMVVADVWSPRGGVVAVALVSGCMLTYGVTRAPMDDPAQRPAPLCLPVSTAPTANVAPSGSAAPQVEVVRPTELGDAERGLWHTMQRRVPNLDNPFLAPEFVQAVGRFHDDARVAVLSQGPDIVGFFPFDRHRRGIGRPIAAGLTDCQGLVHAPGLELDARKLLGACGLSVFEFDHLVEGQPFFEPYKTTRAPSPIMDLGEGYDAYEAHLRKSSPKFLKTTLSKGRKLGREIGDVRFEYDVRDGDALRVLMGWKSDQYRRTGRSDRFAQPWIVALVEDLLGTEGTDFAGVLSMLYANDEPISGHFGLRNEKILVGWFPAYDVRFAKYSPGLIQHLRMAEEAAATGIQHIDMGKGDREYKDSLKSRELTVAEGRVLRASPAAVAYWGVRAPTRRIRNFVLARPRLFGVADRALKRYGRVVAARSPRPGTSPGHSGVSGAGADGDGRRAVETS